MAIGVVAVALLVSMVVPPGAGGPSSVRALVLAVDTWLHLVGYAVLASVLGAALRASRVPRPAVRAWVGASPYGTVLEGRQLFLPYRAFAAGDALATLLGAGLGVTLWCVWLSLRSR